VTLNFALLKALAALIPVGMLCVGSAVTCIKERTFPSALQLFGASSLVMVVLTHVCEALGLLPWMGWGDPLSAGHYLDMASAVIGLSLLPLGYLLRVIHRLTPHHRHDTATPRHRAQPWDGQGAQRLEKGSEPRPVEP
jgi:hypothetical protein